MLFQGISTFQQAYTIVDGTNDELEGSVEALRPINLDEKSLKNKRITK